MNEVEKEVQNIIDKSYNIGYEDGHGIDTGNKYTLDQATAEIMGIMKRKNESWMIIWKDKKIKIEKLQKENKRLQRIEELAKEFIDIECSDYSTIRQIRDKALKNLVKELEQSLKGEE